MSRNYQTLVISSLAVVPLTLTMAICCLAQTTQTQTSDERSETTKSGSIAGRVVTESGLPLANAAVFVRGLGSRVQVNGTATDDEGKFRVDDLGTAGYQVWASAPAYISIPRDPDSTQATYYRVGDSVEIGLIRGGVITGTVTTSTGEPVVGVRVVAYMLRDGNDKPPRYGVSGREQSTDDRGVYRIYGLATGTYIVSAGGERPFVNFNSGVYESHSPTYAPSSSRADAAQSIVRAGEETTNVDIRYRGETGHVVSGSAIDPNPTANANESNRATPGGFTIRLTSSMNGVSQWTQMSYQPPGSRTFSISGIADGDYDITAERFGPEGEAAVSEPRRIKVRGVDITGIELTTKPLGSINGRVALAESKVPECKGKRRPLFAETLVTPWHNEKDDKDRPQFVWPMGGPGVPDERGDFTLRNLAPGEYRFNARFFAKYWYLQSIHLPSSATNAARTTPANRQNDAARNWTTVKSAERVSGLTITLAEGAASIHGQIKTAENQKRPTRLFVYLVPAEREKADDLLRYFASLVSADGSFEINNLPPGRYWATPKPGGENVQSNLRLPNQTESLAKLRQEIEAAKTEINLKPCQNLTNYSLPLAVK